jgi:hypothetical protein
MGRSVSVPNDAIGVFYLDWTPDEEELEEALEDWTTEDRDLCRHDREALEQEVLSYWWEHLVEDLVDNLATIAPSLRRVDRWLDREDRGIMENQHAVFGISEYCGVAAVWVVTRFAEHPSLAERWVSQVWARLDSRYPERLYTVGRFSNGEAVYRRVTAGQEVT